jgi:hypothetical protein
MADGAFALCAIRLMKLTLGVNFSNILGEAYIQKAASMFYNTLQTRVPEILQQFISFFVDG